MTRGGAGLEETRRTQSPLIPPLKRTPPFHLPLSSMTKARIRTGSFSERINSEFCAFVSTRHTLLS